MSLEPEKCAECKDVLKDAKITGTKAEAKKAYRKFAMKNHPDKVGSSLSEEEKRKYEEKFQKTSVCYNQVFVDETCDPENPGYYEPQHRSRAPPQPQHRSRAPPQPQHRPRARAQEKTKKQEKYFVPPQPRWQPTYATKEEQRRRYEEEQREREEKERKEREDRKFRAEYEIYEGGEEEEDWMTKDHRPAKTLDDDIVYNIDYFPNIVKDHGCVIASGVHYHKKWNVTVKFWVRHSESENDPSDIRFQQLKAFDHFYSLESIHYKAITDEGNKINLKSEIYVLGSGSLKDVPQSFANPLRQIVFNAIRSLAIKEYKPREIKYYVYATK
jgi:hypothetical protein